MKNVCYIRLVYNVDGRGEHSTGFKFAALLLQEGNKSVIKGRITC